MAPRKRPFHTASDAEIKAGEVADVYFQRTVEILVARGDRKRVKAEVYLKSLPEDWDWGVLAGIEEAAALLEGVPVDVRAMDEGSVFAPYQPVLTLEGVYVEWAQYETALLWKHLRQTCRHELASGELGLIPYTVLTEGSEQQGTRSKE